MTEQLFPGAEQARRYQEREGAKPADAQEPAGQPIEPVETPAPAEPASRSRRDRSHISAVPREDEPVDLAKVSADLSGSWFTQPSPAEADVGKATRGMRGMLAKMGLPLAPGKAELAERQAAADRDAAERIVRQAVWNRCMTVLVAQRKGGAGKTPTAILLGGIIASIKGGGVVIPEVSDDPGMLALRSEGSPAQGLGELMASYEWVTSSGALSGYTAPQTSLAAVIGSPTRRGMLEGKHVEGIHALLSRYYPIQVLDSGNVYASSAFQAALSKTDALVIPVTDAADSMTDAIALVEQLNQTEHGQHLVRNATVLRLRYVDAPASVVERVDVMLHSLGVGHVLDVPADPHIAEHGELTLDRLQPATRDAFLHAAAAVVHSLNQR